MAASSSHGQNAGGHGSWSLDRYMSMDHWSGGALESLEDI